MESDIHKTYDKVSRIEKEECEDLTKGRVHIFEKIDGANASIWMNTEGDLCASSRNKQVLCGDKVLDTFRGFVDHVLNKPTYRALLETRPTWRIFGEWLVKHTINYPEHRNRFYVFDVYDFATDTYLPYEEYAWILEA